MEENYVPKLNPELLGKTFDQIMNGLTSEKVEQELHTTKVFQEQIGQVNREEFSSFENVFILGCELNQIRELDTVFDNISFSKGIKDYLAIVFNIEEKIRVQKMNFIEDILLDDVKLKLLKEIIIMELSQKKRLKHLESVLKSELTMIGDFYQNNSLGKAEAFKTYLKDYDWYLQKKIKRPLLPWFMYALYGTIEPSDSSLEADHPIVNESMLKLKRPPRGQYPKPQKDVHVKSAIDQLNFFLKCMEEFKNVEKINNSLSVYWFNNTTNLVDLYLLTGLGLSLWGETKNQIDESGMSTLFERITDTILVDGLGIKGLLIHANTIRFDTFTRTNIRKNLNSLSALFVDYIKEVVLRSQISREKGFDLNQYLYDSLIDYDPYKEVIDTMIQSILGNDLETNEYQHSMSFYAYHELYKHTKGKKCISY